MLNTKSNQDPRLHGYFMGMLVSLTACFVASIPVLVVMQDNLIEPTHGMVLMAYPIGILAGWLLVRRLYTAKFVSA